MNRGIWVSEICERHRLTLKGKDVRIDGLGLCNRESEYLSILSYVSKEEYFEAVKSNEAVSCLVVSEKDADLYACEAGRELSFIISECPESDFYKIHEELCRRERFYEKYDFASRIGKGCKIAESAVIEDGVLIGNRVVIGPNTVVKAGSIIEEDSVIGCNSTIGSEGFQLIADGENAPFHVTHVGRCHIGRDVYIGDNTCICNSLFGGETYVADGAKIDNLCHIAHNLYVGKNAVVTAHVIACGSSRIEEGAWIGPNSSILNRVTIGKGAKVGLGSVVTKNVAPHSLVYGVPAKTHE